MSYTICLQTAAVKVLDRVDRPTNSRLLRRLDELSEDPFDPRISKALRDPGGKRSSRVGDWRIIYSVDLSARTVAVFFIEPRGQAYRRL